MDWLYLVELFHGSRCVNAKRLACREHGRLAG